MIISKYKTILNTGAASGIGRETAKLIDETIRIFGRLDGACNNAGAGGELDTTGDYKVEEEASFRTGHKWPVNR